MIKLRFDNPEYEVYGRRIICKIKCTIYETETKTHLEQFETIGKAVCAFDDTFDEKKGMHIAESRSKYKAYTNAKKFSYDIDVIYETIATCLAKVTFHNQMKHLAKNENLHIKYLTKDEDASKPKSV